MMSIENKNKGFSLFELMVAIAILALLMVGIYSMFWGNTSSSVTSSQNVDMQQNARAVMSFVTQDLMTAGFSPDTDFLDPGFVADFPVPHSGFGAGTTSGSFAFTVDANANGIIDPTNDELRAYRRNGNIIQLYDTTTKGWIDLADNIDALNFVYLDEDNTVLTPPLGAADLEDIRSVEVTLVARIPTESRKSLNNTEVFTNRQGTTIFTAPGDDFRRMRLTSTVTCRNLKMKTEVE